MSLFSKFTKSNNEKIIYPWSQHKLTGTKNALPRSGHGAAMWDNQHILVIGGLHPKKNKKHIFLINTENASVSAQPTLDDAPPPRNFSTIAGLSERYILLYGGEPMKLEEEWDPNFYILCTLTNKWSRLLVDGVPINARANHSMCISKEGIMYIFGGYYRDKNITIGAQFDKKSYLDDLWTFDFENREKGWERIKSTGPWPSPRSGHVSVIHENKFYVFGGIDAGHLYNDIWCFDPTTKSWQKIAAAGYIPAPRESCAVALHGDAMYVFGGKGLEDKKLGDLYAFKIDEHRWYTFEGMGVPPSPRFGSTMTVVDGKIYIFGGELVNDKVEDLSSLHVLNCNKIIYPSEKAPSINSNISQSQKSPLMITDTTSPNLIQHHSPSNLMSKQDHQRYTMPNNTIMEGNQNNSRNAFQESNVVPAPRHRPFSPPPTYEDEYQQSVTQNNMIIEGNQNYPRNTIQEPNIILPRRIHPYSPQLTPESAMLNSTISIEGNRNHSRNTSQEFNVNSPPRPPRSDASLSPQRNVSQPFVQTAHLDGQEKAGLMKQIMFRDAVISDMKKKEQWWCTEVSLARHQQQQSSSHNDHLTDEQTRLIDFDVQNDEKRLLFQQLVNAKAEIKKIRSSIKKQAEPSIQKMIEAQRMQQAALKEADYYKSKYNALKTFNHEDDDTIDVIESERFKVLEERLKHANEEGKLLEKSLSRVKIQSNIDKAARHLAEQTADDAQAKSEKMQQEYQTTIEKLTRSYQQIKDTETQERIDASMIADLSNKLKQQLTSRQDITDLSRCHIEVEKWEAANIESRNESAKLSERVEERENYAMSLKILLNEKDHALAEAALELEKTRIEMELYKSETQNEKEVDSTISSSIVV